MHVFIDTNIFLNFFHFSKDDLDSLNTVFGRHKHGSATVHLTQQVCDEFHRNREVKIKDALKRFNDSTPKCQIPSFMRNYEAYSELDQIGKNLQAKKATLLEQTNTDIKSQRLQADQLIAEIFKRHTILPTNEQTYMSAQERSRSGNPPGKNNSIGDAINWILLLEYVPNGEPLHVVSEDGDYFSILNESDPHPFLSGEWEREKSSRVHVYRTISAFLNDHFDGVAFTFDTQKDALIESLESSGSFATTHRIIGSLEQYTYFSLKEIERILSTIETNHQVGAIVGDLDISNFLHRVAVPHLANIQDEKYKATLKQVLKDHKERAADPLL